MAEEEAAATKMKAKEEIEGEISRAMRARVADFKQQADSLTLEGVRRALEKDLGMKTFSLDVHKRFIKQCLDECFYGDDDENESESKSMGKAAEQTPKSRKEETSGQSKVFQAPENLRNNSSDVDENLEESPSLGGQKSVGHETEKKQGSEINSDLSEETLRNAIRKRAAYFRANLEKVTLVEVRRLLEEDLKLKKNTLDAHKRFIRNELDEILKSSEIEGATNGAQKKLKKSSDSINTEKANKHAKKASRDSNSTDTNDVSGGDEEDEEEVRTTKKRPAKTMKASAKGVKKQKKSTDEKKPSGSRKKKPVEPDLEKSFESDGGNSSDDNRSQSSVEEEVKKKSEKTTQVYGKRVEHLKSIIKSCGMSVPPSVYKRVKQAPEAKREASLIKELEEILGREGLSTNPSEKEIKAMKKLKERAKELEGIDMSNIVSNSRRRTTSNYIPPPKPKIEVASEEDEEDEEDEDNDEDTDDGSGESSEGSDEEDAEDESD